MKFTRILLLAALAISFAAPANAASVLYPKFKQALLSQSPAIDLDADTIKVALIDTGTYTYSSSHDFLDDISGVVGTAVTLGSKTTTDGAFDAANSTFTAVSGNSVEALIIYKDTGTPGTSLLIAYIDSASSGLPVTPNGGDITITWAANIFAL